MQGQGSSLQLMFRRLKTEATESQSTVVANFIISSEREPYAPHAEAKICVA